MKSPYINRQETMTAIFITVAWFSLSVGAPQAQAACDYNVDGPRPYESSKMLGDVVEELGCIQSAIGAGGGVPVNVQTFNSSGTWNKPIGGQTIALIECIGGGGSGGRHTTGNASGGGGGSYNFRYVPISLLGSTETVTVGAGGAAITTGAGVNGNPGGDSTFGTWVTGWGGGAGQFAANNNVAIGGIGAGVVSQAAGGNTTYTGGTNIPNAINQGSGGGGGGATNGNVPVAGGDSGGGGGGGGGVASAGTAAGGISAAAGNGGASGSSGNATAGSAPGGGGGAGRGFNSGAGGAGRCVATSW